MTTDNELLLINTLTSGWNISNAVLPSFYYKDSIELHDFRTKDAIKIYTVSSNEKPHGLNYTSYETEVHLTIDIRSSNRDRILADVDEVKRIIKANRKTLTGFEICKITNERKQASYLNYFQYILEVYLHKYRTTI